MFPSVCKFDMSRICHLPRNTYTIFVFAWINKQVWYTCASKTWMGRSPKDSLSMEITTLISEHNCLCADATSNRNTQIFNTVERHNPFLCVLHQLKQILLCSSFVYASQEFPTREHWRITLNLFPSFKMSCLLFTFNEASSGFETLLIWKKRNKFNWTNWTDSFHPVCFFFS